MLRLAERWVFFITKDCSMSNTYQISNLHKIKNLIATEFYNSSTADRRVMLTSYVNTLMRVGVAASPSQAAKMIGEDIGMSRTNVLKYYGGAK